MLMFSKTNVLDMLKCELDALKDECTGYVEMRTDGCRMHDVFSLFLNPLVSNWASGES